MHLETFDLVDFTKIIEEVKRHALSQYAKEAIKSRQPSTDLATVEKRLNETQEAKELLNRRLVMPFMGLSDIKRLTNNVEKGYVLEPAELIDYSDFFAEHSLDKSFFK